MAQIHLPGREDTLSCSVLSSSNLNRRLLQWLESSSDASTDVSLTRMRGNAIPLAGSPHSTRRIPPVYHMCKADSSETRCVDLSFRSAFQLSTPKFVDRRSMENVRRVTFADKNRLSVVSGISTFESDEDEIGTASSVFNIYARVSPGRELIVF